jgi:hypothetical protein
MGPGATASPLCRGLKGGQVAQEEPAGAEGYNRFPAM